jgi:hypothetical protein
MSNHKWSSIVPETYSTSAYIRDQRDIFEHHFTVSFNDRRPIQLLRIDIQDRFYLHEFSLINLDTSETVKGVEFGDKFRFRFVCLAKNGKYKIITRGGKYCYSVFMLESTRKLTDELVCTARSPFNVEISLPKKGEPLFKQVAFRKVGAIEWEDTNPTTKSKVHLEVDPTSAYEVKLKLIVPDLFETEYTPIIIATPHQTWASQFNYDPDLLATTLRFQIKFNVWLPHIAITLRYKTHLQPEEWILDEKEPPTTTKKHMEFITWNLEQNLFDKLQSEDLNLDWQLLVKNTKTNQIVETTVRNLVLQKRNKVLRGEVIRRTLKFRQGETKIYLSRDGQMYFQRAKRGYAGQYLVDVEFFAFKGNFIMEREESDNEMYRVTLMPKFRKFEEAQYDGLSAVLLPELVTIILRYVASMKISFHLKWLVALNLVCKHWFNVLGQELQLTGELSDFYDDRRRGSRDMYPLKFDDWMRKLTDICDDQD